MVQDEESLKKISEQVRRKWIDRLNAGEVDVRTIIEYSKKTDDHKYLSQIRLINVLISRPDWSKATALEVLQRYGLNDKSTIRTLRGSPVKREAFDTILKTAADRWRARAEPPKGWPWSGKLSLLVETAGAPLPDELAALMEDDDEDIATEADFQDDTVDEDELAALMEDDDDEDDEG